MKNGCVSVYVHVCKGWCIKGTSHAKECVGHTLANQGRSQVGNDETCPCDNSSNSLRALKQRVVGTQKRTWMRVRGRRSGAGGAARGSRRTCTSSPPLYGNWKLQAVDIAPALIRNMSNGQPRPRSSPNVFFFISSTPSIYLCRIRTPNRAGWIDCLKSKTNNTKEI